MLLEKNTKQQQSEKVQQLLNEYHMNLTEHIYNYHQDNSIFKQYQHENHMWMEKLIHRHYKTIGHFTSVNPDFDVVKYCEKQIEVYDYRLENFLYSNKVKLHSTMKVKLMFKKILHIINEQK